MRVQVRQEPVVILPLPLRAILAVLELVFTCKREPRLVYTCC
jgi:hypothetical protein